MYGAMVAMYQIGRLTYAVYTVSGRQAQDGTIGGGSLLGRNDHLLFANPDRIHSTLGG
jgi:hypothetical protein